MHIFLSFFKKINLVISNEMQKMAEKNLGEFLLRQ